MKGAKHSFCMTSFAWSLDVQHHVAIMIVETAMRVMLRRKKESRRMTSRCFDMLAVLITVCF